jgi:hypothetical protein
VKVTQKEEHLETHYEGTYKMKVECECIRVAEDNEDKYLQCKQNKRISVLHTLMNENVIEKCTSFQHKTPCMNQDLCDRFRN